MGRPYCRIGVLLLAATGCVPRPTGSPSPISYTCADGIEFSASFRSGAVTLRTGTRTYHLKRRGGSLDRYGSESVAFVRDGSTAVLIGAEGGPFEQCAMTNR